MRFFVRRNPVIGHTASRRYLLIHGNESTARMVLEVHLWMYPGIGYLIDNQDRYVTIEGVKIDPNRLFSRVGAEKSIRNENPGIDAQKAESALAFLDHHRDDLVHHLEPGKGNLLIALHNNKDYSVKAEIPQSDDTSIPQPDRPREFFLCTDPKDFEVLKKSPYNVVLQYRKPAEDDGSLSRLAVKRGFRYVNLECGEGEMEAQLERLRWLEEKL